MKRIQHLFHALGFALVISSPVVAAEQAAKENAPALVDSKKIMTFLPDAPGGWRSDTIQTGEGVMMDVKVNRARVTYHKTANNSEASVAIMINDMVRGRQQLDALLSRWKDDTDPETYVPSRDGSRERLATISGYPVYEELDPRQNYHEFNVIVENRFLVVVQGYDALPEDVVALLKAINFKKLAELK
jgi:hypothetical protein